MKRRLSALSPVVQLPTLALVSVLLFSWNQAHLLQGLDGGYMAVVTKQHFSWARLPLGLTNNFFQSIGSAWFPFNLTWLPAFALTSFPDGEVNRIACYGILSLELFASTYALARAVGAGLGTSSFASWLLVLLILPYHGNPPVYPYLVHTAPFATGISAFSAMIAMLFSSSVPVIARCGLVGILSAHLLVSQPTLLVFVVPMFLLFAMVALFASVNRRERAQRGLVAASFIAVIGSAVPYLRGIFEYTAAYFFPEELINTHATWEWVSIVFHDLTFGPGGPLFFFAAVAGIPISLRFGSRNQKALAIALLAGIGTVFALGYVQINTEWRGPGALYLESFLWPAYALLVAIPIVRTIECLYENRSEIRKRFRSVERYRRRRYLLYSGVAAIALLVRWSGSSSAKAVPLLHPYPPSVTPLVEALRRETALEPGGSFRGRVATLTGQRLDRSIDWFDLHEIDGALIGKFGNDHRMVGLWYYGIPTLHEYNPMLSPTFYRFTKEFLARPGDRQMRNGPALRHFERRALGALGVKFVVTDAPLAHDARLSVTHSVQDSTLYLYELTGANVAGYSPTRVRVAENVDLALVMMKEPSFDFAETAILSSPLDSPLAPVASSHIAVEPQGLKVSAISPGVSLLVLPLEYSECLRAEDPSVRMIQVDYLFTGVIFTGTLDTRLNYFTSPWSRADCRHRDYVRMREPLRFRRTPPPAPEAVASRKRR